MKLESKVIMVIGATGGIGSVLAQEFHREGATVVLTARTKEKLKTLAEKLGKERTLVIPTNAANMASVRSLFALARHELGHLDAVVISAGTWDQLSVGDTPERASQLIEGHYLGIFRPSFVTGFAAQEFFRERGGGGLIVNISSHAAIRPELAGNLTYGPMKAAARHFMLSLRHELASTNVRVTDIQPAIVNTPNNAGMLNTPDKRKKAVQPEAIAEWIIANLDNPNIPAEKLFDSEIRL